jgi:uncharacterized protein YjbI with pentapeptide repeats
MAETEHLEVLAQGVEAWNDWRAHHPDVDEPDFSFSRLPVDDLNGANLARANLRGVIASGVSLRGADLSGASLIHTHLNDSDLEGANLDGAFLHDADLSSCQLGRAHLHAVHAYSTDFSQSSMDDADLSGASLEWSDLSAASLCRADLSGADLTCARLIGTNLTDAVLTGATVHGASVWAVTLDGADQRNLIVSESREPVITVDDLELAFFVHQLLQHGKVRELIEAVTAHTVLLLGRFTPERKRVLDLIRDRLRELGYVPIVFDFEQPGERDLTETITTLARLSRFIVADLTEPASIPKELEAIAPRLAVPIQPILQGDRPFSMFADSWKYDWILQLRRYQGDEGLLAQFETLVTAPAEAK